MTLEEALAWFDAEPKRWPDDWLPLQQLAEAARLLSQGVELDWCEPHGSHFLEQIPNESDMCLWMLHENNWDALPAPEPCRPTRQLRVLLDAKCDHPIHSAFNAAGPCPRCGVPVGLVVPLDTGDTE
jgi:hypothetical protein